MSKRKGKALALGSGGKRFRENGRLKLRRSDSSEEFQEKILQDAGFDAETMKDLPETEIQAIIKAIKDSNQANKVVLVDSSESDGKDSPTAELEDETETQPPDCAADVFRQSASGESSSGPHSLKLSHFDSISPAVQQEGIVVVPRDVCDVESKCSDESDNSKKSIFVEEEQEGDKDDQCDNALSDEVTQQYEDEVDVPSVLAAETQFPFPDHKVKGKASTVDVVPESPLASPVGEDGNADDDGDERTSPMETDCDLLTRIYPGRSATSNCKDFLPRYCPGAIKELDLYTQAINSMFDIYLRRIRLVNSRVNEKPVKWGNPVKTGLHCENLLKRKTMASGGADKKDGKGSGRVRRRIIRRDSPESRDNGGKKTERRLRGVKRTSSSSDIEDGFGKGVPNVKLDNTVATKTVFDLDDDSSSENVNLNISGKNTYSRLKASESKLNLRRKSPNDNEDIATSFKFFDVFKNTDNPSLDQSRNSPSPVMNYELNSAILPLEIEILDDDSSSEPKNNPGSWLSARQPQGPHKKDTSGRKRSKKNAGPDSPQVKSLQKGKRKKKDINQRTISVFIAEKDACDITEIHSDDSHEKSRVKEKNDGPKEKDRKKLLTSNKESNLRDDLTSSIDSTYMLNSQGDMYSTQMAKVKLSEKKKKVETGEKLFQPFDNNSSSPDLVVISSERSRKMRKKSSVEEIEILDEADINDTEKTDVIDNKTASTVASRSKPMSKALRNRKKRKSDEDFEIVEGEDYVLEMNERNRTKQSDKTGLLIVSDQQHIGDSICLQSKRCIPSFDEVGDKPQSKSGSKRGLKLEKAAVVETSSESKSKGKGRGKNKRRLFDESSYTWVGEAHDNNGNVNLEEGGQIENEENADSCGLQVDKPTSMQEDERPSTTSSKEDQSETAMDKGTCPICNEMFKLNELEAHASTCGEGTTEEEASATAKCMICHKDIERDVLKEHQTKCAESRIEEIEDEVAPRRLTRAKNTSASGSRRKKALTREKSPSSSGEDYGELVIEVDKGE